VVNMSSDLTPIADNVQAFGLSWTGVHDPAEGTDHWSAVHDKTDYFIVDLGHRVLLAITRKGKTIGHRQENLTSAMKFAGIDAQVSFF